MEQFFRRPQDVVGKDDELLDYWNTMPGSVQLRLLQSNITVATLGELQLLQAQLENESI
jgi:hypothetical protein